MSDADPAAAAASKSTPAASQAGKKPVPAAQAAKKPVPAAQAGKKTSAKRGDGAGRTRHLVIVESPAKAETIGRFLGDEYIVDASYGHVRDLPGNAQERPASIKGKPWAELGVNVDEDFEPVYIVPADKKDHVRRLKQELRRADRLLIATDEDREGESIGWHLLEVLQPDVPVERIVFHEVTKEAIEQALQSPRQIDRDLVAAQEARRILDRLYGYSLSPLLWRKVQAGLSAGRVQSVGVRILVQRERERALFHRAEYWDAEALVRTDSGRFTATLRRLGQQRLATGRDFDPATGGLRQAAASGGPGTASATSGPGTGSVRLLDEAAITTLVEQLQAADAWTITKVEASPATKRPAAPFTTSTLQQEANRKLGFGARRTMSVAQSLYEGLDLGAEREGLITYMRTDSVTLSDQALNEARGVIAELYGAEFGDKPRHYRTRTRNAQEAHEAIRPTQFARRPEALRRVLSDDQYRLYELIWKRTLASQMADARLERSTIEIEAPLAADGPALFEARGSRVLFAGYLRVYAEGSDEPEADADLETLLPAVSVGQSVSPAAIEPKRHETQPPARYTEASLVRKLEEEGLGRPSTYASILGTIQERGYVFRQGNALVPSFLGFAVTELLEQHFADLVEPGFTAEMEDGLDAIARGETDTVSHLRKFYHGDEESPGLAARIETETDLIAFPMLDVAASGGEAPDAEAERIVVRIGRFGPYLQCGEGGPGKTATLPPDLAPADLTLAKARELLSAKQDGPRSLGHDPESSLEVFAQSGRFGPYVQLGPNPPSGAKRSERPKRASVAGGLAIDDVTLEDALLWLSLPRTLGPNPADGEPVVAASGRYGPYIQSGKESRSLPDSDDIYSVELERALELLAQPKAASFRRRGAASVLADLGLAPETERPIRVLDGRYGPYATDGETNASLPRDLDPATLTIEQALALIAKRAAAPKRGRGRKVAKRPAARKTAKKTARKTAKKSATKTAKKATKRPTAKKSSKKPAAKPPVAESGAPAG